MIHSSAPLFFPIYILFTRISAFLFAGSAVAQAPISALSGSPKAGPLPSPVAHPAKLSHGTSKFAIDKANQTVMGLPSLKFFPFDPSENPSMDRAAAISPAFFIFSSGLFVPSDSRSLFFPPNKTLIPVSTRIFVASSILSRR